MIQKTSVFRFRSRNNTQPGEMFAYLNLYARPQRGGSSTPKKPNVSSAFSAPSKKTNISTASPAPSFDNWAEILGNMMRGKDIGDAAEKFKMWHDKHGDPNNKDMRGVLQIMEEYTITKDASIDTKIKLHNTLVKEYTAALDTLGQSDMSLFDPNNPYTPPKLTELKQRPGADASDTERMEYAAYLSRLYLYNRQMLRDVTERIEKLRQKRTRASLKLAADTLEKLKKYSIFHPQEELQELSDRIKATEYSDAFVIEIGREVDDMILKDERELRIMHDIIRSKYEKLIPAWEMLKDLTIYKDQLASKIYETQNILDDLPNAPSKDVKTLVDTIDNILENWSWDFRKKMNRLAAMIVRMHQTRLDSNFPDDTETTKSYGVYEEYLEYYEENKVMINDKNSRASDEILMVVPPMIVELSDLYSRYMGTDV